MATVRVVADEGGQARIDAELRAALDFRADLRSLEAEVVRIVHDTNREDRLEGLDRHGGYLIGLAPSTLSRRSGSPIPFVEHGAASRVISNLIVDVNFDPGEMDITLMWVGMPWLKYHVDGGAVMPERDFAGISPWALPLIDAAVVAESDRQFPGQVRQSGVARGVQHGVL